MLTAPFRSPYKISVTQEFMNHSNDEWYIANGIDPGHNGTDVVFDNDTPRSTFGTECICPFDSAVVKVTWSDPHATKGNGVTIMSSDGVWQVVFWHTCELAVKEGDKLKKGDVVCYVGNSGLCRPERTILKPFNGSHCHLMVFKNGILTNPRELFDFSKCEVGQDTGFKRDMWGISDYVSWMSPEILVKYFRYLGL